MGFASMSGIVVGSIMCIWGLVYILVGEYENRRRDLVLIGKSAVFVGASYIFLGLIIILIMLAGGIYPIGLLILVVGSILAERLGEAIYERQDKSMDTVPKFKPKSKRKLKNEEKLKRPEKPKNGPLPY